MPSAPIGPRLATPSRMITPDALAPYLDPSAVLIVAGGTLAATVLRTPLRDIGRGIAALATLPRRTLDATPLIDQVAALGRIAKRHGVNIRDVMRWNSDTDNLRPGDQLTLFVKNSDRPES